MFPHFGTQSTLLECAHLVFAATLLAHVESDPVSLLLGGQHVDVVGDEELAGSHQSGTPAGHKVCRPKVWLPLWLAQLYS